MITKVEENRVYVLMKKMDTWEVGDFFKGLPDGNLEHERTKAILEVNKSDPSILELFETYPGFYYQNGVLSPYFVPTFEDFPELKKELDELVREREEIQKERESLDWKKIRVKASIAAMQSVLGFDWRFLHKPKETADLAVQYADALIEKLKE